MCFVNIPFFFFFFFLLRRETILRDQGRATARCLVPVPTALSSEFIHRRLNVILALALNSGVFSRFVLTPGSDFRSIHLAVLQRPLINLQDAFLEGPSRNLGMLGPGQFCRSCVHKVADNRVYRPACNHDLDRRSECCKGCLAVRYLPEANKDKPATITLRQGPAGNLKTLKVLTTQAGGGSFTWVPEESLPEGADYAFQIEQSGSINYSGLVKLAHQPGKEPPPSTSKKAPLPSDSVSPPLGGTKNGVQKGNNGYIPVLNSTSSRLNMTSSKSTTSSTSSDGNSFRYVSPELLLGGLAVIVYFAA
ncbi:hypothetical protein BJX64DRAFT_252789 [Aspergillus heterothallicus]